MKAFFTKIIGFFLSILMALGIISVKKPETVDACTAMSSIWDSYIQNDETFTLTEESRIFLLSEEAPTGELLCTIQLSQRQFAADNTPTGEILPIVYGSADQIRNGDIVLDLSGFATELGDEGFELNIGKTATVKVSDTDGLLYGLNTLQKYLRTAKSNSISGFTAVNIPDTDERTVMLDCARKYFTPQWICNLLKEMSWMGYNTLELHITEDSGFRADIWDSRYFTSPEGNNYSWLCGGEPAYWLYQYGKNSPFAEKSENRVKYLTASDLVEICKTAKEYHIEIIPSIDTPAHSEFMNTRYCDYIAGHPDYTFTYNSQIFSMDGVTTGDKFLSYKEAFPDAPRANFRKVNYSDELPDKNSAADGLDVSNPVARAFMFSVIRDYAVFFSQYAGSTKFNIGTDEVNFVEYGTGWEEYAVSNNFGRTKYDAFLQYVNSAAEVVKSCGYTPRAFNDTLYCQRSDWGTPTVTPDPDIEIVYWSGYNGIPATVFTEKGHKVYNAVSQYNYYVLRCNVKQNDDGTYAELPNSDYTDPDAPYMYYRGAREIYDEWSPSRMYNQSDDPVTVPDFSGGYYLIWCDFPGYKTEEQIWYGSDESGKNNVRQRMWANCTKMWNTGANADLSFDDFETKLITAWGDFPGFSGCSCADSLLLPSDPVRAQ